MIASLLLSLLIWVNITSERSDEWKKTFHVMVEFAGEESLRTSKNLVITDVDTNTVVVEIIGPRRVVSQLRDSDLTAQIDVSRIANSAYTSLPYSILFPDGVDQSNLQVSSKTPSTINFMVSKQVSKSVQVIGSFDGSIAEGYSGRVPEFDPAIITVSGPEAYIKDISYAYVSFGAEEVSTTYSVETGFTLKNAAGEECDTSYVSISDQVVTATLIIDEMKTVPLGVKLIYGAGATEDNVKVTVEPENITLTGDSAILSTLNHIVLATVDLTDFNDSYVNTYPIMIDNGLTNESGITTAEVRIEITGLTTKHFTVDAENISCTNVTNGFSAEIVTESMDVILRGTPEQLAEIKPENIRVAADLTDFNQSVGSYRPTAKVYVTGYNEVGALGQYTISIVLRKAQT